jgi:nitroreductase
MSATILAAGGDVIDVLRQRRSIRRFEARPVAPQVASELKEALLRAPSSRNLQPWRFVFVEDRGLLAQLASAKTSGGEFLADAPLGVVVTADERASDCWIEDCSIAATCLQLTAAAAGLGSCWIQVRGRDNADGRPAEEHVREALSMAPDMRTLCIVALGYPAELKPARTTDELAWDRIDSR